MGNLTSRQQGGEIVSKSEINQTVDKMLTHLLQENMEDFVNKNFCKKQKIFIRDDILMKQAEGDLGKLIIGKSLGGADSKPELCEKLSHHFLKKLNLIASINMTLRTTNDRMSSLKHGGQCFKERPNMVSSVSYAPLFKGANTLHYQKFKNPYQFSKRHVLEIDGEQIRKMAFEKISKDKRGGKLLKSQKGDDKANHYLPDKTRTHLLVREIAQPDQCQAQGGTWLKDEEQLVKHGLKPNREVDQYNKAWHEIINNTENNMAQNSHKLLSLLKKVMDEKVIEVGGEKKKMYLDIPINDKELVKIVGESKVIINNMLSDVDKAYLLTSSLPLVSDQEVKEKIKLELQQKQLNEKLKQTKNRLSLSN